MSVPENDALSFVPDVVLDAVYDALKCSYDCTRVWEAWSVGTMTQDDFVPLWEDSDRVFEISKAALDASQLSALRAENAALRERVKAADAMAIAAKTVANRCGPRATDGQAFERALAAYRATQAPS